MAVRTGSEKPRTRAVKEPSGARARRREKLPKDLVLLQLALVLMRGGTLTYERLTEEFLLARRTAERYVADLRSVGLPVEDVFEGKTKSFRLARGRARKLQVEAVDVPPEAARPLSLLLVAAKLLPQHFGVREAIDATVRAALRLRGVKAASELRRLEDAVLVLENDAKNYEGTVEIFEGAIDAVLEGRLLVARYRSPRAAAVVEERFFVASLGLYKGGLYALAVGADDDGERPMWRALERIESIAFDASDARLSPLVRQRAIDDAKKRWGPARPRPDGAKDELITLHFSRAAAPYVLARPWHPHAEIEAWPDDDGGGARMAIRLAGDTGMFESWVRSWGPECAVLRPSSLAERIAASFEDAARRHRAGAARFQAVVAGEGETEPAGE
jgi:predicted DNA-binding transcriptional regulator YafY